MSFAFNFNVDTKDLVLGTVETRLDEVIQQQPCHARDKAAILQTVQAYLDMLDNTVPEGQCIAVNVAGSVNWQHTPGSTAPVEGQALTAATVNVGVWFTMKV